MGAVGEEVTRMYVDPFVVWGFIAWGVLWCGGCVCYDVTR